MEEIFPGGLCSTSLVLGACVGRATRIWGHVKQAGLLEQQPIECLVEIFRG
jgi:H+/Cl- antiporter ClcA